MSTKYTDKQINDMVKEGTNLLERAVILLFDNYDELTIDTICEKLELNEDIVEPIIFSLKDQGKIELKISKSK